MTEDIRELVNPEPKGKKTFSLLALLSFLNGILAYLVYLLPLLVDLNGIVAMIISPISAFTAILSGHKARRKMRNKEAIMTGKKLAGTGMMLGYIYFALVILALVLVIAGAAWIVKLIGGLIS
jgi:hypothetical protein